MMKAIILAAGLGTRLKHITATHPKPLVAIGKTTILNRQLDSLIQCGITDVIIVTGHIDGVIQEHLEHRPDIESFNIKYVYNHLYNKTGTIFSLWLTRRWVYDDIILLHGDLVFDTILLERILKEDGNAVLVKKENIKDFTVSIIENKVTQIHTHSADRVVFNLLPLYKFVENDFKEWIRGMDLFIEHHHLTLHAEFGLDQLLHRITLKPLYLNDEFCMEIDTLEDLKIAREHLCKK